MASGNRSSRTVGRNPGNARNHISSDGDGEDRPRAWEQMMLTMGVAVQKLIERDEARTATPPPQVDYLELVHKHQPPTYGGEPNPEKLEEWINTFDKLLTIKRCPDERKVEVATYYLTKFADQWWRGRSQGLAEGYGWEELKEDLRDRFYPMGLRSAKHEEFSTLQQGSMTVHEYYAQFMTLLDLLPNKAMTDREMAQKFEFGLNTDIREALGGKQFASLQKVYDRAVTIERQRQKRNTVGDSSKFESNRPKD